MALDSTKFKAGNTYSFSAAVMQPSTTEEDIQLTLQYNDASGTETYAQIASASAKGRTWTKLENTSYTIPEGATDLLIYFEMPKSLSDFYVDSVLIGNEGTKSAVTTGSGKVEEFKTPEPGSFPDPSKPMIGISFDDGASPSNNKRIVDALAKQGFTATFFYVSDWSQSSDGKNEIKYAYSKGMEIANHTTTHPYLTKISASEIRSEYDTTTAKLKSIIGAEPSKLMRLPFLDCNDTVKQVLNDVPLISCAIDTADWNGASKDAIESTIKNAMNNGSLNGAIVLCHENYSTTSAAMAEVIPYLKDQGWQVVTISEMFAVKGQELNGGTVYTRCA
jgi:peptidoglycan/xylan/chitin deacetylase (PgdA/CDA1 family)